MLNYTHFVWYIDTYLPFGYRHRSALFQQLSNGVHQIMVQYDFEVVNYIHDTLGIGVPTKTEYNFEVVNYIHDTLGIDVPTKTDSYDALCTLLDCLGFQISQ